jgi:IS5 family transposase
VTEIEPFYSKGEFRGYSLIRLEHMLRMYVAQWCFRVSGEGIEDAIYDGQAMRDLIRIDLSHESVPDATTLLKFRRLLETNHLTERIYTASTHFWLPRAW